MHPLLVAGDMAEGIEPPGIDRFFTEAQHVIRDAHLHTPTIRAHSGLCLPHAIPCKIIVIVVEDDAITNPPRWTYDEESASLVVVMWIEIDRKNVSLTPLIAPG